MNIELDNDEGELLIKALVGGGIGTLAETRTLTGIANRIKDKMPRPFEKGDIVHAPYRTSASYARMEVKATAHDGVGREEAWCLDANGNLIPFDTAELAHGERP